MSEETIEVTIDSDLLEALRERGHSEAHIQDMSAEYMFNEYCNWHGLVGFGPQLRRALDTARKIARGEKA